MLAQLATESNVPYVGHIERYISGYPQTQQDYYDP